MSDGGGVARLIKDRLVLALDELCLLSHLTGYQLSWLVRGLDRKRECSFRVLIWLRKRR